MRNCINYASIVCVKLFCADLKENYDKELQKFNLLKKEPENLKNRIYEYQIEYLIKASYSTDKNNRILVILTFIILFVTMVMLFK